jgi:Lrp/AsnC family transcriptional regulator for asnA, asnC and gidA
MELPIDRLDARIIALLQQDGRVPYIKIARTLGISETTVRTRVQRLLEEGVVQIVAVGDPFKLGFGMVGTFKIQIDPKQVTTVIDSLRKIKEIWYIALATGSEHIDTEFNTTSLEGLRVLLYEKLNKIEGIVKIDTSILMSYEKRDYTWGTGVDGEE